MQRTRTRQAALSLTVVAMLTSLAAVVGCRSVDEPLPMPADSYGAALYVENCAPCHGITGLGNGSAAIGVEVRPRNFRAEDFRYVATTGGPPTDADLLDTIRWGRREGAMPGFPHLDGTEAQTLADYVREMRRLGLMDRLAIELADEDLEPGELEEISADRVEAMDPDELPGPGLDFVGDTARGRELYMDGCASCHGPSGRGDGLDLPLDENKNPIEVRDITTGEFRGGTSPSELYRRIRCGIPGTPMPSAETLTSEEIWQLVRYVELLASRR